MGLLDILNSQDPATQQGLIQFGLGLLSSKGNLGNALGMAGQQGLQGALQARDRASQQKRMGLMDQLTQGQIAQQGMQQKTQEQAMADAERQRAFLQNLVSPQMQSAQQGLMGGGGPTVDNAAKMPTVDPMQQMLFGGVKAGAIPLSAYMQSLQKDDALIKASPGDVFFDKTGKQRFAAPAKPADQPSAVKEYEYAKRAGASNVSMSVGAEKAFAKDLGAAAAKTFVDSQDAAQAAQGSLANVASVRDATKAGGVILGPGSQARQTGLRIGQTLGVGGADAAGTLARTKQVEQGLASLELDAAQLMKGQGVISESERLILRKVSGGQIQDLSPSELDTALNAIERNAKRRIDIHRQRVKQVPAGAVGELAPFLNTPEGTAKVRRFNPATGKIE
jgi:hypothetical protein